MSASIKLARTGKKKYATYRIVVMDKRKKRNGSYIDKLGFYNPNVDPAVINIDEEKLKQWLKKGAVVSEGLQKLLKTDRSGRERVAVS
ncbi:30S ribosomal protein S16 [Candidatus Roizmanbacteria bacterium CG02_land_8_20_14_3_00_36_15]|uniref:Small ribosomal subunit protein bS16 n=2 Tax=Candidatus Roizmaniibacteriota TaxID=1752723 RepID=A0A2M8KL19_9BACT|nr:MAG: 30S ribosomal protein S16 [Candidatus Roizmanbacteria bacterium CG03_land_8_20_14_0_80_36_21]PIV37280.1 MAG: 30S ribosomal protein S16 [Candidatus Roizmanbacteria bacterium CG02_land_8_20_14_3_00_36_15]PIY70649.1 MAG: 30S ribosomal protein S16 [Candidatus Roizmanbacteria bacterium CG_4_10_14_0_8_um_filter_36_36]PJA53098.1 MAG: 30S ribosomal protein S16 [Candidatus Roizmanbacteria bacterium CG_4_9_14_3_um_filter_36_11]PJC81283.1 MAG: 30S ribosomal protein S16 [Candidatus Roizmanbacteria 